MRRLPRPTILPEALLADCIDGTADQGLQQRLTAIRPALLTNAAGFELRAGASELHLVPRVSTVGAVSKDELTGLYTDQMSSAKGSGRWAYDKLRNSAPNKRCPLCGVGTVATLDHHLPKSKYPDLSVVPLNLVPACHYCNDAKRQAYPSEAGNQTIHPYFDDFEREQWLFADILEGPPVSITYRVAPPASWSELNKSKAARHFKVFKLSVLFSSNANEDLVTLKEQLDKLFANGGAADVEAHLVEEASRYHRRPNSWQYALYHALAQSRWFVEGGFQQIAGLTETAELAAAG